MIKLLKCYTQCISKYGKFSHGHRTGKGQFSFQSQRRAMPKNVQTIAQLYSFHTQARRDSKSQFSFQSQRRAMPKNVQTIAQLHSSHMLAK